VDDVAFLSSLIEELGARPVFVTGFSNGAAMAFRLALEQGQRLSAVAPVAGYCWLQPPVLSHGVPTFYLVGAADPLVLLEGGKVRSPWGWSEERPPVSETIERWRHALGETAFEVHIIPGLGHHWPGGRGQLSSRLFGPALPGCSANELIWEFFRKRGAKRNKPERQVSD
jgi:polyhydroxybutyrate depolymerase